MLPWFSSHNDFIVFNFFFFCNRQSGPIQSFSHVEAGSPPSAHDPQAGYSRFMSKPSHLMPHIAQNSPSRLGQPPVQRYNYMRPSSLQGSEWNQFKVQPPSSFNSGSPRSPGSSSFNNGMPWGISLDWTLSSHSNF